MVAEGVKAFDGVVLGLLGSRRVKKVSSGVLVALRSASMRGGDGGPGLLVHEDVILIEAGGCQVVQLPGQILCHSRYMRIANVLACTVPKVVPVTGDYGGSVWDNLGDSQITCHPEDPDTWGSAPQGPAQFQRSGHSGDWPADAPTTGRYGHTGYLFQHVREACPPVPPTAQLSGRW